jgi:hypothetical protein
VHRHKVRETVARLCRLMMKLPPANHPPLAQGTNGAAHSGNGAAGEPQVAPPKADQSQPAAN